MILKPQDVLILLKLVAWGPRPWGYQALAAELFMSASEVHAGVRRAVAARLMDDPATGAGVPLREALEEFLVHGVRYAFAPERGAPALGVPTGLQVLGHAPAGDAAGPVWPSPQGTARGYALSPLYASAPAAALRDPALHALLALLDVLRDGDEHGRELAIGLLQRRLDAMQPAFPPAGRAAAYAVRAPKGPPSVHAPAAAYATARHAAEKLRISQPRLAALCSKYGIARLSLFGSAARNELTPDSDVDLMVEFRPGSEASLFDLPAMQEEFAAAFGGRKVDIATPEILANPYRRQSIVPDLKLLHEA